MVKTNNIRKRALEYAKKRQWEKALQEFERLVEVEQNNPNVYNEIGDLYLKLGQKREAFQSYHKAVDAYSNIALQNNAVAVCKKILRLNPTDQTVCGKLAMLRHRQGFQKDAEAYALTFLGKVHESGDTPAEHVKDLVVELAKSLNDAAEVLEHASEYLIQNEFQDEAGKVLEKLDQVYTNQGLTEQSALVRQRMDSIGFVPAPPPGEVQEPDKLETVEAHRSNLSPGQAGIGDFPDSGVASGQVPGGVADAGAAKPVEEYGTVELGVDQAGPAVAPEETVGEFVTEPSPDPEPRADETQPSPETADGNIDAPEPSHAVAASVEAAAPPEEAAEREWVIPDPDSEPEDGDTGMNKGGSTGMPAGGDTGMVEGEITVDQAGPGSNGGSAGIIDQLSSEVTADIDEEDHRSHYDLGMAYLEMNLLTEAIREFQFATNSSMYQIRSLEMIGRCFLEQNKPELAIKQLKRGLSLVGDDDDDSLGIRYNLGVAYEMTGDMETARGYFEDVYVVDVTFRDVAQKVEKYAS